MRTTTTPLARFGCLGVLLLAIVGCTAPRVGNVNDQTPAAASPNASPASEAFLLYVQPDFTPTLAPLDPVTLEDAQDRAPFTLAGVDQMQQTRFFVSPDGATVVALVDGTVRVINAYSGEVRAQFPRPEDAMIDAVSPDGTRLVGRRMAAPGKQAWVVVSAKDGETLVNGEGDHAVFDWEGERVYSLETPGSGARMQEVAPQPVVLLVSDLETGREVDRLTLDGVLTGSVEIENRSEQFPAHSSFAPSMTLTPDRRRLVLLHGDADKITLVDVEPFKVLSTRELGGSQDPLVPGAAVRGWDMKFAPDGMLYVAGNEEKLVVEEGQAPVRYLGVRRINVEQATVEAEAFIGEDWGGWYLAPDGSAIYYFSNRSHEPQSPQYPSPTTMLIRRLDPQSLEVTAERELDGFHWGYIVMDPRE